MKKMIALLFMSAVTIIIGACSSDKTQPYNPVSTADTPTAQQSQDSGLVGYNNFDAAINDTTYTQDKVSTQVKPLMNSGISK